MASADLRDELKCSICLNLYKEPISLKCGHSFCWNCIVRALDTQEESGLYSCPECRVRYTEYPTLEKNRKLCNIVECFRSAHQEETEVLCTYCDFPTAALKTCLLCEASFCEKHLSNHSKSPDHILTKPTASFGERKCSVHQEVLKYYCTEDSACICMSCWVAGEHRGHQVELLNEASEKKKANLRESTIVLDFWRREIPRRIENLESHRTQEDRKQIAVAGRVTELFRDIRRHLDDVEERVLTEISRQKEQVSQSVSDLIQQLETQQNKLSRKMNQMKELCKLPDPLIVLKTPPNGEDISPEVEDSTKDTRNAPCINEQMISQILDRELHKFTKKLKDLMKKSQFSVMEKDNILFDINTAHENIFISKKQTVATYTAMEENRSDGPNRFKSSQVLSLQSFTSGEHYWEVDVSEAEEWLIGVATETIERKIAGRDFIIGYNDNSWALSQISSRLHARHRDTSENIESKSLLKIIGIYLDYEAGHLSFYQMCDPIRHLHTFSTTFTGPLYAAFYMFPNTSIRIIRSSLTSECPSHRNIFISTMASADLKEELNCSICLSLYTEPISLKCGHNFCRDCIVTVLDTQKDSGEYFCPECREQYKERPPLEKNRKLCNIVECFRSTNQEEKEVLCTYCDSPTPASKSCLHCEASFCDKHLSNHSKSVHHLLIEPTTSFGERKCSIHQEILKYYCTEDSACICMSCWVAGDHRGHQVDLLNEASEKIKENLRTSTNVLDLEKEEIQRRIQTLENHRTEENGKTIAVVRRVTEMFREIRKQLEDVEKRVLLETCRQKKQISHAVSSLIQKLEEQKDELSKKINQMKELCNIDDPLTVLKKAPNREDLVPGIGETSNDAANAGCITEGTISQMLQRGLCNFTHNLKDMMAKRNFSVLEKSDIVLDINTAHDNLILSKKRKRVSHTDIGVNRPDGPKRFKCCQVLSVQNFASGTHYWEVDVSEAEEWLIGVASESMERKIAGDTSFIGCNDKSWSLIQRTSGIQVRHKNVSTNVESKSLIKTVGIYLEYEAGHLSFYQLCDPIRHLHTFTTTFTEPLHAAFYVFPKGSIRIIK
ncbi:uncharacterized protein LOC120944358 [Rana temporaria]|uniref:uncharacterized protein LOC120944358 n=1 Tax=Rana temporaria TaxID=8407 RepID=UPI001AAD5EDF|nr:uncharacterized protein LOC120944358 [Rana temporaria]